MGVVYAMLIAAGGALFLLAIVWLQRTRRVRTLWRTTHHDASRVAIVLELEEVVHELELTATSGQ
jgi:hypothetical protein